MWIEKLYQETLNNFRNYLDLEYIQYQIKSNEHIEIHAFDKNMNIENIERYLERNGYVRNQVLGKTVMVKGFTCVHVSDKNMNNSENKSSETIEIWHDKCKNKNSLFITCDFLTHLPLALKYMERI